PPQPGVGVQNHGHDSTLHESRIGATTSSWKITLPTRLECPSRSTGTSFATGRPRFVTTSGSPVRATRSRRDRQRACKSPAGTVLILLELMVRSYDLDGHRTRLY